jgi:dinuclear metal center YbgI/SA1388 family protein
MKIQDIIRALEELAPPAFQEPYDNAGLTVGDKNAEATGILCTLDVTDEVLEEALRLKANMIVSHHPVIFTGMKSLTGKTFNERIVIRAVKNDIALYACHTNIDNVASGVNSKICEKLGLTQCRILSPLKGRLVKLVTFVPEKFADKIRATLFENGAGHIGNYDSCSFNTQGTGTFKGGDNTNPFAGEKGKLQHEKEIRIETILPDHLTDRVVRGLLDSHPYEEVAYDLYPLRNDFVHAGSGMIGELESPLPKDDFFRKLKNTFDLPVIKYAGDSKDKFMKIAVCGGAGSFLIQKAIRAKADVFLTGDIKYHQYFDAEDKITICDIGHYESEQFTKEIFYHFLTKKFSNFAVHLSRSNSNPIKYHV